MNSRNLLYFLVALLCVDLLSADADVTDQKFKVHISGLSVMITCPAATSTNLKKGNLVLSESGEVVLQGFSPKNNGLYNCGEEAYLYLNAYVCETCTDVSIFMVVIVLIADCLVTLGVSVVVYIGCKRKSGHSRESGFANGAHKRDNRELPPPVPNPDYEPLQKGRQDLYDGLNRNFK